MASYRQDDFVPTISDSEGSYRDHSDEDTKVRSSKKRAHLEDVPANSPRKKHKKHIKQRNQARYRELSGSESASEESGVQEDAIDPDFVFDLGAVEIDGAVDNSDSWGIVTRQLNGNATRIAPIDKVIARRMPERNPNTVSKTFSHALAESDQSSIENGNHEDEQEITAHVLDSGDELLAEDSFGAQAVLENESLENENSDRSGRSEGSEPEDSENGEASPSAHPKDLMSESESDDEVSSQASQSSIDSIEAARRADFFASEATDNPAATADKQNTVGFSRFSLSRPLLRAVTALSFSQPTPVQERAIPVALRGLDVVGSAQTGSGKTAAFLLPILERLLYRSRKMPMTRVVVLMPTRELAVQCYNVAVALARYTDITFAQVVGGFPLRQQEIVLKKRPDVIIATPGRFIDHMRNSASFQVDNIEILVLDEADRMLEDGFADELDEILKTLPRRRQTMLFSATMTDSVDKLIRVGMDKPVRVSVDAKKSTVDGLVQECVRLRPGRENLRLATLCILCQTVFTQRTIVFFRQKWEAHKVKVLFGLLGIQAGELHGSMSQEQRITAVSAFRDGRTTHLLATDLASRGLDIKNVMSVVNYEAPQSHEIYLHRVGRTARAGRSGRACTIAAEPDRKVVKAVVKLARSQGTKVVSRAMNVQDVNAMQARITSLEDEIAEVLREEKQEKALAQAETQIKKGENLVKHEAEIMSRPKRTWFESEKEKRVAKEKGLAALNGSVNGVRFVGEKKKLSNKQKKRLDSRAERLEGKRARQKITSGTKDLQAAKMQKAAVKTQKRKGPNNT